MKIISKIFGSLIFYPVIYRNEIDMKNGQKLQLIIDDKTIECDESGFMTMERTVKHFKFHAWKMNNFKSLYEQTVRISPRYFNPNFPIDCDIARDGDDLVKDKLTIRMSQDKF